MTPRRTSAMIASGAGVVGAIACALTVSPGDGSTRVTMIMRAAVVFLALALGATLFAIWRPHVTLAWIGAAAGSAASLAVVFGFFYRPPANSFGPMPGEALGPGPMLPALVLIGALVVAAFVRDTDAERRDG